MSTGTWRCGKARGGEPWRKRLRDHPLDYPFAVEFWKPQYLRQMSLEVIGEVIHLGRKGFLVRGHWRGAEYPDDLDLLLTPGVDEWNFVVDAERGIILKSVAFLRNAPARLFRTDSITFDVPMDDELFSCSGDHPLSPIA
ncbi:MAG: hypothetical protein LC722_08605 [Actinobacteria bacterium]|nr:hypothetical protein [Actinomycetota bacterium]